jgi:hypothetical protein
MFLVQKEKHSAESGVCHCWSRLVHSVRGRKGAGTAHGRQAAGGHTLG